MWCLLCLTDNDHDWCYITLSQEQSVALIQSQFHTAVLHPNTSQSDVNDTLCTVAGVGLTKHTLGYNTVLLQIGLGHCGSCNAQDLMGGWGGGGGGVGGALIWRTRHWIHHPKTTENKEGGGRGRGGGYSTLQVVVQPLYPEQSTVLQLFTHGSYCRG